MSNKHIQWLHEELPDLIKAGVLPTDVADKLRQHYGPAPERAGKSWALLVFGILGAALIGAGVILLVAHNWDDLSRPVRTALAFAPLLAAIGLAGWVLARRSTSAPWCEGAATAWALTIGATISLVAQIYQIHGDPARFFLTWILLGLPIVYVMRSSVAASLYFIGTTTWVGCTIPYHRATGLWYWGLLALMLPYLASVWRENRSGWRASLTGWVLGLCLCIGTGISLETALPGAWIVAYTGLLALMYLADKRWCAAAPSLWQRPWQIIGAVGLGVVALELTYRWPWTQIHSHWQQAWTSGPSIIAGNLLAALLAIAAIGTVASKLARLNWTDLDQIIVGLAPVCGVAGYMAATTYEFGALGQVLFNVYLFILGLGALIAGIRGNRLGTVNAGLVTLAALVIARFFDSNLSFLARGLAFIFIGIGFLATNVVMLRRKGAVTQ